MSDKPSNRSRDAAGNTSVESDRSQNGPITPPGPLLQFLEMRAPAELASLLSALPRIRRQAPRGTGQPVIVLPGFMAEDSSTWPLRSFLSSIGYRAHPWSQGRNRGRMLDFLDPVLARIEQLSETYSQPVRLVGWSRGGILARECARDRPELIDRVVTLGSPVSGGPDASSIGQLVVRETGMTPAELGAIMESRIGRPITVPITAIYSRTDGVVAWRACIDDQSPHVTHHEVVASHVGLGISPAVFPLVATALASGS